MCFRCLATRTGCTRCRGAPPSSAAGTPTSCWSAWCTRQSRHAARREKAGSVAGPTTAESGPRRASPSGPPPRLFGARRRLRLPRRRTLVIAAVAAALLGGGTGWLLYGSSWLRADRVTITGADVLTPSEVRKAAAVPLDTPLVAVDTGAIGHRLRDRLPRIAKVDVSRSWPDTISLDVTERKAEVIVEEGGKFREVDA